MTKKVYTSAQGQTVDLGTIKLRNEHVRAVGNMNVNARGDVLDSNNRVIETKSRQVQRQNSRLTNVADDVVYSSGAAARRAQTTQADMTEADDMDDIFSEPAPVAETAPVAEPVVSAPAPVDPAGGGLAAAIARSKVVKQEKEKTARQLAQDTPGVRKI